MAVYPASYLTANQSATPPAGDPPFDILYAIPDGGISPLTTGGTLTIQYPVGLGPSSYIVSNTVLSCRALQKQFTEGVDYTVTLNPTNITVAYLAGTPIPAGSQVALQLTRVDTTGGPGTDSVPLQENPSNPTGL
jgi:hypothetical protein